MPIRSLVPRNGDEVFAALLDAGLPFVELGHKRKLSAYLMACQPKRRITCVERTGWHGHAYVLPQGAIGLDVEGVILQTTGYSASDFTERGTLTEWQQGIASLAVGNSRLCFALSLAFAAPLLALDDDLLVIAHYMALLVTQSSSSRKLGFTSGSSILRPESTESSGVLPRS